MLFNFTKPQAAASLILERRLPGVCSFLATQTVLIDFEERVVNEDTQDYQPKIEENVSEVHRG